jgi:hypothetical protein
MVPVVRDGRLVPCPRCGGKLELRWERVQALSWLEAACLMCGRTFEVGPGPAMW